MAKQKYQIDSIDRRILRLLQSDATLSHAAIADEVGASPASCWRRLKALNEAGVIGQAVRLVDAVKLGKTVTVICEVRMKTHDRAAREAFERLANDRNEILECYSMSGEWDYLLRVIADDVSDYERFLMNVVLAHPSVAATNSQFALAKVKYTTAIPVD